MKSIPNTWPTGEKFPILMDISSSQKYYSVKNLWMSREELVGSTENIISTSTDDDLARLGFNCGEKYNKLSIKYFCPVAHSSQES